MKQVEGDTIYITRSAASVDMVSKSWYPPARVAQRFPKRVSSRISSLSVLPVASK